MPALEAVDRGDPHDSALECREQTALVHEELERLPEKDRSAVVLCCLEELTIEEAARRLRCTSGVVRGRLAQARSKLRARLARRGFALPSAVVVSILSAQVSSAAVVPPALRDATARAALRFFGSSSMAGAASGSVVALASSVSRFMLVSRLKVPASIVLGLALVGTGAAVLMGGPPQKDEETPAAATVRENRAAPAAGPIDQRKLVEGTDWFLSAVDPDRRTIALDDLKDLNGGKAMSLIELRGAIGPSGLMLRGLKVAADARITIDGRPGDLRGIRPEMRVNVALAPDRFVAANIRALSSIPPATIYVLDAIDVAGRTISVTVGQGPLRLEKLRVAEGAKLSRVEAVPNGPVRHGASDFVLEDLRPGMPVALTLEVREDGRLEVRSLLFGPAPEPR